MSLWTLCLVVAPLAIVGAQIAVLLLRERMRRRRRAKELRERWAIREGQLRLELEADLVERYKQIDQYVADGLLPAEAAQQLKEDLRKVYA